ncbi:MULTISPECIES: glutathione S-transferase family protein [Edaphosphingomonas]|uniref:Glutathione S-transferase family protein n=1 Tax=Edaphosphingomonas fennica TaxID=114404 RepID=A0A2T4I6R0_9SPHN|nr:MULTISPECIES: glutathione S-transferase family protein [Sphingomonas]MDX3886173.1 glutathione S-transferase family protein [Sphingomonas sp.]PTD26244.1 glutathione S-transferase family protein [Sphingomonas fennica]
MSELIFYTNPQSRGRIVRWMLEEVGAPYRTEVVGYGPAMKGPDYLAINPMGKVPAIRHGGAVVTEAAAICAYLADAFPAAGLAPPTTERADYYRWLFFAAGPIEAAVTDKTLKAVPTPEQRAFVGYGCYENVVDVLDVLLSERPYFCGESFTAADVYAGSQIAFGLMFKSIEERPSFRRYVDRIQARPAYARAAELDDAAAAAA